MNNKDLITSISILLNQSSINENDILYFENKKHDELVEKLRCYLFNNKSYIGNPKLEILQGLNDHGVDLLLETHDGLKVGFQVKSHFDVSEKDFSKNLKRQITESSFHNISKLYILICSPYDTGDNNYKPKIANILSELSGFKTNFHCAYSPISCIGLFINNKTMDEEHFHLTKKRYIIETFNKEDIINEVAPEEFKTSFLSRIKNEKATDFETANNFIDYIKSQGFEVDIEELAIELKNYCNHLKTIPAKSRDFFVSVLSFAEPYGKLGNCINCVKSPYMDIIDSLEIDDREMLLRIRNLERHKLLGFDEDEPYEDGQMVISIKGSNIDDDLNISFEVKEYFENDLSKLKEFYIHLNFKMLD